MSQFSIEMHNYVGVPIVTHFLSKTDAIGVSLQLRRHLRLARDFYLT
jgi:hypothetical protein